VLFHAEMIFDLVFGDRKQDSVNVFAHGFAGNVRAVQFLAASQPGEEGLRVFGAGLWALRGVQAKVLYPYHSQNSAGSANMRMG